MFLITRRLAILLVALGTIFMFSSTSLARSAALSPRDNPEFQDKLSGVLLFEPAGPGRASIYTPNFPGSLRGLPSLLDAVPIGPNVLCNQDQTTQAQNEPSIAVNPTNPLHIIATSNDYRLRVGPPPENDVRAGYYVSFDGGLTWPGDGIIDISSIPNTFAAGDPAISIHDLHNVYFSYIAFNRTTDDGGLAVSKSTDGGLTWQDPVVVAWYAPGVLHDKPYHTVDATGSQYDGNVYVSWTRFEFSYPIFFSRSTDGGATFSTPYMISDASLTYNQGSVPVVSPDGTIYVAWYNYNQDSIRINKSTNGGASFGTPSLVSYINSVPYNFPGGDFRTNSFPTMAIDPNNGYIYAAWSDYDYAYEDADILFTRSTNGGTTWSTPVRINDDPLHNQAQQFFPWMDVAPNGNLYIGWFDSRLDPTPEISPMLYDEYAVVSTDGGLTFSPNQRMSEVTADSSTGNFSPPFIGDYSGLAATNDFVYPAWVDTRRDQEDIFTQSVEPVQGQKQAPAWVELYVPFTYSIYLSSGTDLANNQVSDPIPAEVAYLPDSAWASSGTVGFSDGVVTWSGDITGSIPITITFGTTPTAAACSPIDNIALLTTGQGINYDLTASSIISGTPPSPDFTWVSSELVFTFTNETSGTTALDYIWDFGDGITSTEESPVHEYAIPGEYTVTLTASNLCGTAMASHVLDAVCSVPQAGFSWLDDELTILFSNQSTGRFPLSFLWDFGDGITSTLTSPLHTYNQAAVFDVSLSATDLCGTGSITDQVTTTCTAPTAYFTWEPDDLSVIFSNLSSGTQPQTYAWDFGDGDSSSEQSPTHLYTSPGRYTVHLTATGPCGTDDYTAVITVGNLTFIPLAFRQ